MKPIAFLFNLLLFLLPLTFFPHTSELFEFNKMILVYIFTVLIVFCWSVESIYKKRFIFKKTVLDLPIIIFLGTLAVSTLNSIDPRTSMLGYYGRFHGGLLSYSCYATLYWAYVSHINKKHSLKIIKTILISLGMVSAYAALEHTGRSPSCLLITGNFDASCWVQDVESRVFGTFGQPNWLAAWIAATIPLAWASLCHFVLDTKSIQTKRHIGIVSRFRGNDIKYFVLFVLPFTTLLFTKSRSGLLGFAIAFTIFWSIALYVHRKNVKKILSRFLLTTSYCLLAAILIWNPLSPPSEPPTPGVTESGDIRKIVWEGAIKLWKRYPLLGTGPETFAYSYYETRPVAHNLTSEWNFVYNKAHNEYLNFLATTGTVGFSAYVLLIITSLFQISNVKFLISNQAPKNKMSKKLGQLYSLDGSGIRLIPIALLSGYISILVTNFFGFSTVAIGVLFFLFPAIAFKLNETHK